jgi:hypothetical protein
MILRQALNSRRPEIITVSVVRPMEVSNRRTTVKEVTIVTVKNAGNIRSHHQWRHQAIYHPYEI